MPTPNLLHPLSIAAAAVGLSGLQGNLAAAQPATPPNYAMSRFVPLATGGLAAGPGMRRAGVARPVGPPPIAFFVATGPADACGPGCDRWIAADGKIDPDADQRLRRLLARLGRRRLPLFLHSAGGSVLGAIELGTLIRSRNMEVSVARTVPAGCEVQKGLVCEMRKRSGDVLESELDPGGGMCNSACVLVLAGGAVRSVPPWVRLGVHAIGFDGVGAGRAELAAATRSANARIVRYLHDMGIPKALFDASNAVPNASPRFLRRDELVRFRLDTRAFGETGWRFTEQPSATLAKGFFMRTGGTGVAYPEALLRLGCSAQNGVRLTYARERPDSVPPADPLPVSITVNGSRIDLPRADKAGNFEMRSAALWPDALPVAADGGAVEISGFDVSGGGDSGHVVLNMAGFSTAYAKLRSACDKVDPDIALGKH